VSVDEKLPRVRRPKREAVMAVLIELYPAGPPRQKLAVLVWDTVNRRLRELGKRAVSQTTVARALYDFRKSWA
jgi:hypothetical protein